MRLFTICLTLCLLLCTVGCTVGDGDASSATETTLSTTAPPTTTTAAPTTTAPKVLNPLTGVTDLVKGSSTRAIGVMLGNDSPSRPQRGIDKADWFIEMETEGGITRIMAVFANTARVPKELGPVRSARTPFVLLSQSLDLIYAHAGGSKTAMAALEERDMADVNALVYDGSYFWRDSALRKQRGYEYSMLTSGSKLTKLADKLNFRREGRDRIPFTFNGNAASGNIATQVQCKVSYGQTVNFKYYPDEGLYYKRNGTLSNPTPHASEEGIQLSVSNIIVLFDRRYEENSTTIGFDLTEGEGMLFTAGRARSIRWSRTSSSLRFTETDGSEARVSTGKTYILLVNRKLKDDTFYRS